MLLLSESNCLFWRSSLFLEQKEEIDYFYFAISTFGQIKPMRDIEEKE